MPDIVQLKENGVNKYMKTHADAIDGIEGKLVKAVGNETILGTKNFQDGIQVKGKEPVLTNAKADYAMVDKDNNASVMSGGSLKLYRRGDLVYLTGSFQLSALKITRRCGSTFQHGHIRLKRFECMAKPAMTKCACYT
ncbi:hypothetical protein EfsSVR2332_28860 [Enterococcus faecalis]|uniref:Uncharacterized protein n=2 Tax=Enterococcus faecalis TaxID=1351 RepID=A0AC59HT12_ENTFL|nr:hypothetical protein EfsSVR2332_09860 [Enterococcus faecalis]BDQ62808.1 hypothetical protein EfsSVR2332_28860 [Enterococcus faecalis]